MADSPCAAATVTLSNHSDLKAVSGHAPTEYDIHSDVGEVLFTREQLAQKTLALGRTLAQDYRGKRPLFLPILKGGFICECDAREGGRGGSKGGSSCVGALARWRCRTAPANRSPPNNRCRAAAAAAGCTCATLADGVRSRGRPGACAGPLPTGGGSGVCERTVSGVLVLVGACSGSCVLSRVISRCVLLLLLLLA
jgi:hypothetical protein